MLKTKITKENNYEYTEEEKEEIRKILLDTKDAMAKNEPIDEETIENIYTDMCIRQGLKDAEEGNVITTEELLEEIESWPEK